MKLELPDVPDITDININRLSKKRDDKILEEIIKPKDDVIQSLQNLQNARKCGIINIMAIAMLKPL